MSNQQIEEITCYLNQANECRNDQWQMWSYAEKDNTLVLCGYRETFLVSGYLLFRGTKHICLARWLNKPIFRLGDISEDKKNNLIQSEHCASDQYLISISTEENQYYIVCREVKFYALPKGAHSI